MTKGFSLQCPYSYEYSSVLSVSLLCQELLKRLDINRNCAVESWQPGLWVLKEVFNILYLCIPFLSRSSYPFVDSCITQCFYMIMPEGVSKKVSFPLVQWYSRFLPIHKIRKPRKQTFLLTVTIFFFFEVYLSVSTCAWIFVKLIEY